MKILFDREAKYFQDYYLNFQTVGPLFYGRTREDKEPSDYKYFSYFFITFSFERRGQRP
jgi:hypothetical protein